MKRTIITLILLANAMLGFAQHKNNNVFEIGGGVNAYGILGSVGGPAREFGPGVYFEFRNAFAEHFDAGVQLNYKHGIGHGTAYGPSWDTAFDLTYNQVAIKALLDCNACPSRFASPYIGVGFGVGEIFEKESSGRKGHEAYGTLCPRIGVQLWRFRLALEVDFAYNGEYGFLSEPTSTALNIGFTF